MGGRQVLTFLALLVQKYLVYLLYWYKRTKSDAAAAEASGGRQVHSLLALLVQKTNSDAAAAGGGGEYEDNVDKEDGAQSEP